MGESRRKREAVLNDRCPCGTGLVARQCCFNGLRWHKSPAILGLKALPAAERADKCYMKSLGSCAGPISREHLISESVIRIMAPDGKFSVLGVPRLNAGKETFLAPGNFVMKCLCAKHNSAIHPLDDAAKYFFESLKAFFEPSAVSRHAIVSGHDIERWLLKTIKALAVSKSFAKGQVSLSGALTCESALLDMLDDPRDWREGAGLYCAMNVGDLMVNDPRTQFQPIMNDRDEIEGALLRLLGLNFVLHTNSPPEHFRNGARFRPSRIVISQPSSTNWVTMSWEDDRRHEELNLRFLKTLDRGCWP